MAFCNLPCPYLRFFTNIFLFWDEWEYVAKKRQCMLEFSSIFSRLGVLVESSSVNHILDSDCLMVCWCLWKPRSFPLFQSLDCWERFLAEAVSRPKLYSSVFFSGGIAPKKRLHDIAWKPVIVLFLLDQGRRIRANSCTTWKKAGNCRECRQCSPPLGHVIRVSKLCSYFPILMTFDNVSLLS